MLVDTLVLEKGDYKAIIDKTGKVIPDKKITLSSEVSGKIDFLSDNFFPGSLVKKNEVLAKIDASNYALSVSKAQAHYNKVKADYTLELGKQKIAQHELKTAQKLHGDTIHDDTLILRQPHLDIAKANLLNAKSALDQAQLELSRTIIKSPFDAMILDNLVDESSVVNTNGALGSLVATDMFLVEILLPNDQLRWFTPNKKPLQAEVQVPKTNTRFAARVKNIISVVNAESKMGRVVIEIQDPMRIKEFMEWKASHSRLPSPHILLLGDYVDITVYGHMMHQIYRINSNHLHSNNTIWLYNQGVLNIQKIHIVFSDKNFVYTDSQIDSNKLLITSYIAVPKDGMKIHQKKH